MSGMITWIAAGAERAGCEKDPESLRRGRSRGGIPIEGLPAHGVPGRKDADEKHARVEDEGPNENPHFSQRTREMGHPHPFVEGRPARVDDCEKDRQRRIYRGRTAAMLRRYMRYSIETGRLPSLLGREFFRSKVTSYTVVTFEDRVIFVHDMEKCLNRLDEFSRQIIARHILQEHDQAETGRLLQCTERTVRTYVPMALDLLSEILVEVGLLELQDSRTRKCCQEGGNAQFSVSDCEDGKNKV